MTMGQTVAFALVTAVAALFLREAKSPLFLFLPLLCGVGILLSLLARLAPFEELFALLEDNGGGEQVSTVIKVLAVGFLAETGSDLCRELGAPSLGEKVDLVGKAEILLLALPTLLQLMREAVTLLS